MRPRINRSSTRDGHDRHDYTENRKTTDSRPRKEGNGRPEKGHSGPAKRSYDKNSQRDNSYKSRKTGFGTKPGDRKTDSGRPYRPARGKQTFTRQSPSRQAQTEKAKAQTPQVPVKDNGLVRLNKFIANSGICSRREADEYITAGLITVNGNIVTELGTKVKPEDDVRFNGERLKGEKKVYVVMNKPKDFVTTTSDPHAEKNVMQLISRTLCPERIFPVGRLDKSTTGVLLLTNDGELAEKLTHPSFQKKKIYQVTLDKNVKPQDMDRLVEGITLDDGPAYADEVAYNGEDRSIVGIEIHSGRNRIVRRMFEALGYKVRKLDRVYFAGLTKKNLRRGQWRFLSDEEVTMLKLNFYE